ncbi:hypothetical protein KIL84_005706 [Mauremys mutica]|uniref:Uncharacterized protein n=1 Tax=Mauremys mutica TaxID=74926 RepID=A0A9D4B417_9SAUR|nr:hypothetical protein KIL84_005706 [Mauremys mutica]
MTCPLQSLSPLPASSWLLWSLPCHHMHPPASLRASRCWQLERGPRDQPHQSTQGLIPFQGGSWYQQPRLPQLSVHDGRGLGGVGSYSPLSSGGGEGCVCVSSVLSLPRTPPAAPAMMWPRGCTDGGTGWLRNGLSSSRADPVPLGGCGRDGLHQGALERTEAIPVHFADFCVQQLFALCHQHVQLCSGKTPDQ